MIVIPDKFVFVHMPRTGGTWLTHQLRAACPDLIEVGDVHDPLAKIPAEYSHLPTVAVHRDPVDWIESYYNFRSRLNPWNPAAVTIDRYRVDTIDNYVTDLLEHHPGLVGQYAEAWVDGADYRLSFENLVSDAAMLFEQFGLRLKSTAPINGSYREAAMSPALAERWRVSNADYCERYGYPLPDGPVYQLPDWSGHWRRTLHRLAMQLRGRPVNLLEIGVCEGRGAQAAFEVLLRHPESRYIGIDIWQLNPRHRADRNIALISDDRHLLLDAGTAADVFGPFDVVYIDGDHTYDGCQSDLIRWSPHVRPGGFLVIDDYGSESIASDHPGVRSATDKWMTESANHWTVVSQEYQLVLQRRV